MAIILRNINQEQEVIILAVLKGIKPERVMYYFEEITKIPRCSHHEEKISNYLAKIGRSLGLEVIQDEALNIIIKKPATKGYESSPTVILQGHMDMVCEKTQNSNHDFSKDPIKFHVEGDYITAEETTLGADNGIALAMILAILESKDIPHPPLEALITSNEESGMTGAKALDPENLKGRILINLDSEEEGTILVSCAGGERNIISIPIEWKGITKESENFELIVSGLKGGHSGIDINRGRGNSNKIIGRILGRLSRELDYDLYHIEGGSKANAIPRYAKAKIMIPKDNYEKVESFLFALKQELKNEFFHSDKGIVIELNRITEKVDRVFSDNTKNKLITALNLLPNGVQSMSMAIEGLVESSNNLGVIKTFENQITLESAIRSSVGTLRQYISEQIELLANIIGASFERTSSYPAWQYKENSYIREVIKETYRELYNEEINVSAIHAGLECGIFDEKFDDIDMVSLGPNMYGVHAPGEKLSISSTERTYNLLLKVLEKIK